MNPAADTLFGLSTDTILWIFFAGVLVIAGLCRIAWRLWLDPDRPLRRTQYVVCAACKKEECWKGIDMCPANDRGRAEGEIVIVQRPGIFARAGAGVKGWLRKESERIDNETYDDWIDKQW